MNLPSQESLQTNTWIHLGVFLNSNTFSQVMSVQKMGEYVLLPQLEQ